MTILAAIINKSHALLIADRRITANGQLIDDEQNKICVLFCDDAKMSVAFTGFEKFQGFDTSDWIAKTLSEIGQSNGDICTILAELSKRATRDFSKYSAYSPKLTMLFCGFVYWDGLVIPSVYTVSNLENKQMTDYTFQVTTIGDTRSSCFVEFAGVIPAIPIELKNNLLSLLAKDVAPQALLRFAVRHLSIAARSDQSGNLIGQQFNSAVIDSKMDTAVTSTYHSKMSSYKAYGASVVVTRGLMSFGIEIFSQSILASPEIRKKDPCWCGSGKKFKNCHLVKYGAVYVNLPQFSQPIPWSVECIGDERPIGRKFCVTSGYV